ncbi:semialdehyde dehydrogenase family protein [Prunus dulcis]|uniref:Semialdehyde dehydrogenase family protein n=1 Tax=Prunus dulcis TaxID=3755 RepID=A0A5H2XRS2_PRUDU|nr:semialdehyde dehydrogenase family protein [Prunus dulcis]
MSQSNLIGSQLNDTDVKVTATCIRVPVMRAHAESINLQFENPLDEDTARDILKKAPGLVIIDDRTSNNFPTPLEVSNKDDVAVGRIRRDMWTRDELQQIQAVFGIQLASDRLQIYKRLKPPA